MKRLMLTLAVIPIVGCIATETGNPTFTGSSTTDPGFLDGALLPDDPMLPATSFFATVGGGPGAITPAEGEVWVFNLEADQPPATEPVEADGSFRVTVEASDGQRLRLHVVGGDGAVLSNALDFQIDETGIVLVDPIPGCVSLDTSVLALSEPDVTADLVVYNDCETPVTLGTARIIAASGYEVTDTPLEIGARGSATLSVAGRGAAAPGILQLSLRDTEESVANVTLYRD